LWLTGIGGSIANFAETATEHYTTISDYLEIITQPGSETSDEHVRKAIVKASSLLKKLGVWAQETQVKCEGTVSKLTAVSAALFYSKI